MSQPTQLNNLQYIQPIQPQLSLYLTTIIDKKVNKVALSCIETIVDRFLTIFSCFYPAYANFYQERLVERINVRSRFQNNLLSPSQPIETPTQNGTVTSTERVLEGRSQERTVTSSESPQDSLSSLPNQNNGQESVLKVVQEKPKQTSKKLRLHKMQKVLNQPVLSSLPLKKDSSAESLPEPLKAAPLVPIIFTVTPTPSDISLKEFQKRIKAFYPRENNQQIAAELFQDVPKDLELNQLVNFIFEKCKYYPIRILDAFQFAYSTFVLSPWDQIRKAIVIDAEDGEYSLTNDSLLAILKEHGLDNNAENFAKCCRLAYRCNHPYIYPVSQTPIPANDYSLNFFWVNLNPQNRVQDVAQNIFKDGLDLSEDTECIKDPKILRAFEESGQPPENWKKIEASFTYKLSKWADIHPHVQMNLWYDSALVTQKARQKTFEMMKAISESRGANLKLRDIRQLPNISGETENTLHPGAPVYYRVDLLKVLITDYLMNVPESPKYCVVSDIDVEPMDAQRMFDQRTVDYLAMNGYIFNRVGVGKCENNFFIFNKGKEDIQRIHNKYMIQVARAEIAEHRRYPIGTALYETLGAQSIYSLYSKFRREMGEDLCSMSEDNPRKVVQAPRSQFNLGGIFPKSDHKAETFRFIGDDNVPYTRNGRNFNGREDEGQIQALIHWTAEPLPPVES